jgi:hypothetical protein
MDRIDRSPRQPLGEPLGLGAAGIVERDIGSSAEALAKLTVARMPDKEQRGRHADANRRVSFNMEAGNPLLRLSVPRLINKNAQSVDHMEQTRRRSTSPDLNRLDKICN